MKTYEVELTVVLEVEADSEIGARELAVQECDSLTGPGSRASVVERIELV